MNFFKRSQNNLNSLDNLNTDSLNMENLNADDFNIDNEKVILLEKTIKISMMFIYVVSFFLFLTPIAIFGIFMVPPKKEINKYMLLTVFLMKLTADIMYMMTIGPIPGISHEGWDILETFSSTSSRIILFLAFINIIIIFIGRIKLSKISEKRKSLFEERALSAIATSLYIILLLFISYKFIYNSNDHVKSALLSLKFISIPFLQVVFVYFGFSTRKYIYYLIAGIIYILSILAVFLYPGVSKDMLKVFAIVYGILAALCFKVYFLLKFRKK